jgi:hypothetical protein
MSCRTDYCIGGGCVPTTTSVQAWLSAFGYEYDENDPLAQDYANVIAEAPSDVRGAVWDALCEACMRARAMLFCNSTPGDSGTTQSAAASSNALGVSLGKSLGTEEQIGSDAATALGIAVPGVGAIAGAALDEVLSIFAAHAKAEEAQSNALSSLSPQVTQAIRQADYAVANGTATPEDAQTFLENVSTQMASSDASLTKSCNAFCGYNAIVAAIAQVSQYYYALIVPAASATDSNVITGIASPNEAQANELPAAATSLSLSNPLILVGLAIVAVVLIIPRRTEVVRA